MIGVFPFPLLRRLPHRRVRSTIDAIPNFSEFFVDKMGEPGVVGMRQILFEFRIAERQRAGQLIQLAIDPPSLVEVQSADGPFKQNAKTIPSAMAFYSAHWLALHSAIPRSRAAATRR